MTKVLSLRVPDDLAEWAEAYAKQRGVTRQALIEEGLRSFQADCESGVPEIRAAAARQSSVRADAEQGVGDCPDRPGALGHVWKSPSDDPFRSCRFCGTHGREPAAGQGLGGPEGGGYFARTTAERMRVFNELRSPGSSHGQAKR